MGELAKNVSDLQMEQLERLGIDLEIHEERKRIVSGSIKNSEDTRNKERLERLERVARYYQECGYNPSTS